MTTQTEETSNNGKRQKTGGWRPRIYVKRYEAIILREVWQPPRDNGKPTQIALEAIVSKLRRGNSEFREKRSDNIMRGLRRASTKLMELGWVDSAFNTSAHGHPNGAVMFWITDEGRKVCESEGGLKEIDEKGLPRKKQKVRRRSNGHSPDQDTIAESHRNALGIGKIIIQETRHSIHVGKDKDGRQLYAALTIDELREAVNEIMQILQYHS